MSSPDYAREKRNVNEREREKKKERELVCSPKGEHIRIESISTLYIYICWDMHM
jgi:hypothetical protein